MKRERAGSRQDGRAASSLQLDILFYFPSSYRPKCVETVVHAVKPWLTNPTVSAEFEDLLAKDASFAHLSDTTLEFNRSGTFELGERRFRDDLHSRYVVWIQGTLGSTDRRFTIAPFVDPGNTTTVGIHLWLYEAELSLTIEELISTAIGERQLLDLLDRVNPLWAAIGVEAPLSTLGGIAAGQEHLPGGGYYGSELVAIIGRDELARALEACQKVVFLPRGGVFFSWSRDSKRRKESAGHERFEAKLLRFEAQVLARFPDEYKRRDSTSR